MKNLTSTIETVTVFTDRAQITRTAQIELEAGEHLLVFDKLPADLIQNSIQVNGLGNAMISHVKYKKEYHELIPEQDKQFLYEEEQKIKDEQRVIQDRLDRLNKEKKFVENIAHKLTNPQENEQSPILEPEKWASILDFYQQKLTNLDTQIFDTEKSIRTIDNKLDKIEAQIRELGTNKFQKTTSNVEVLVQNQDAGIVQLSLSYLMHQASWQPIYDLRVSTEDKSVHLSYHAKVFQKTGEDWENCQIKLSTAKPQIGGEQPHLNPWRLNLKEKRYYGAYYGAYPAGASNKETEVQEMKNMIEKQSFDPKEEERLQAIRKELTEIQVATANVQTSTTAVTFIADGKQNIKSGSDDQKVTVLMQKFSGHFRYSTVPKLSPYAYLKVKIVNHTDFPLLSGEANVFLDNNFVANSVVPAVAPSEDFWTFLGIDEGMKVEHKFLKKYEKKEGGLFSKKVKVLVYEYLTEITNHKKTKEEIVVWDQLPISENESIKIQLMEPKYKEDTDTLKKTEYDYLEWFFQPEAGEKIEIPFKFLVEYPQEERIEGLE